MTWNRGWHFGKFIQLKPLSPYLYKLTSASTQLSLLSFSDSETHFRYQHSSVFLLHRGRNSVREEQIGPTFKPRAFGAREREVAKYDRSGGDVRRHSPTRRADG
nr:hypothetical protein Iba_chr02dCG8080 [Ipomoea batatas]GMC67093.1 hypothetical protein Iba_chr02eCG11780 [Ipomoea batatas]GMD81103.1 hypothetical protein Iba_chr13eCG8340 [Ipomoea batatas]GME16078.1 hypothetical protein Iba_scaffold17058CG0010 [Ipomoea batatas]